METRKIKYLVLWGFLAYALIGFLPTFNASAIFHVYYMVMMYGLGVSFLLVASIYLRSWVRNVVLILAFGGFLYLLFLLNINTGLQYWLRTGAIAMGALASIYTAKYLLEEIRLNVFDYLLYAALLIIGTSTGELLIITEALTTIILSLVAKSCRKTWLVKGIWWFLFPFAGAFVANTLYYYGMIGTEGLLKFLAVVGLSYATIATYFLFTAIELYQGIKKVRGILKN